MTHRILAVATRSGHKLREIREILEPAACIELRSLDELQLPELAEEDDLEVFDTFAANAAAKARYFAGRTGLPTVADDSGICIDALGGEPGVRSKRFSGRTDLSGAELDRENNRLVLERLAGVPPEHRSAHYVCAAVLARPTGEAETFEGRCHGRILDAPRGAGGFGYDPLFLVDGFDHTFGELPPDLKNRVSHRARAFRALGEHLCPRH